MNISSIDQIQTVKKVCKSQVSQMQSEPLDVCSISSESKKKAEWVEMLKSMPDIREEKIIAASSSVDMQTLAYLIATEA